MNTTHSLQRPAASKSARTLYDAKKECFVSRSKCFIYSYGSSSTSNSSACLVRKRWNLALAVSATAKSLSEDLQEEEFVLQRGGALDTSSSARAVVRERGSQVRLRRRARHVISSTAVPRSAKGVMVPGVGDDDCYLYCRLRCWIRTALGSRMCTSYPVASQVHAERCVISRRRADAATEHSYIRYSTPTKRVT